jgi:hypothetical protein
LLKDQYSTHALEKNLYTQMNSKVGNLARRRLEFESAKALPKQLNLKSLAMEADPNSMAARRNQKPTFEFICVYMQAILFFLFLLFLMAKGTAYPNRFYIGPDIFYRNYHEHLEKPKKSDEYGTLFGFQTGYDYTRSGHMYGGTDFSYAGGNTHYDGSALNVRTLEITPHESTTGNTFLNLEGRIGYTFLPFQPFAGFGWFYWKRDIGYIEKYRWTYAAYGLRLCQRIGDRVELGLNLKLMQMINGHIKIEEAGSSSVSLKLGNRLQYEIELPITYIFQGNHIDIRAVPYYAQQDIGKSECKTISIPPLGRVGITEPSSSTYIIGGRLEIGYRL